MKEASQRNTDAPRYHLHVESKKGKVKLMETRVAGGCQGQDAEETEVL